jgi:ribonuclease T2
MRPQASRRLAALAAAFTLAFLAATRPGCAADGAKPAGGFDFYVLSLSWSPSYCAAEGPRANKYQCGNGRHFGFIVHGLWPQYEHGYPKDCQSAAPRRVEQGQLRALSDIMPGYGLIIHEWRTHGLCTGLSQEDYFATLRDAYRKVRLPPAAYGSGQVSPAAVEEAFMEANPGLPEDGVSVDCDKRYLREVRICMTKGLSFRPCPELEHASCRRPSVAMPPP